MKNVVSALLTPTTTTTTQKSPPLKQIGISILWVDGMWVPMSTRPLLPRPATKSVNGITMTILHSTRCISTSLTQVSSHHLSGHLHRSLTFTHAVMATLHSMLSRMLGQELMIRTIIMESLRFLMDAPSKIPKAI